ncbi:sugar ABC transporter substrate-binding protein [Paenibacillus frigoriresistens]|uniref:sugar ABC transporter substrate-binding protein n=1 Tax=Paenibacillus alginolyticus TaxID=59839 RepID=UPI001565926C|nr:sugar ABC transporter substrate-binding protein [Paenibacillus frigoriresistens]NRF96164.1 sugar ABC transporter substrate-binding protein [Paenibacillus frigoriresistens]
MKKALVLVGIMLLVGVVSGCGSANSSKEVTTSGTAATTTGTATTAPVSKKEVVIGVSMLNISNEFITLIQDGIKARAKELNAKVIINDGQKDPNKQIQQVENFIAQKVDAIILNPIEEEATSPAVEKAKKAGIPIINVNSVTKAEPDAFVGSKDEESAKIAIDYIAERLGKKGNLVMMHGHPGQTAEIKRTEGALAAMKNYPDLKLIAEQTANWDREAALSLMQNWIQANKGKINAVFAQNDEMGMGALKALENAGLKKDIVLISVDAIADALKAVKDGRLDATVFQNANGQGAGAVDAAMKLINKEKVEKEVIIPFELVTKDNVNQYLK